MIIISKVECLNGIRDKIIYSDSHPKYEEIKNYLLFRKEIEEKNGLFSSSYTLIEIDDISFNLNYVDISKLEEING